MASPTRPKTSASTSASSGPCSALHEILKWSASWPLWQRDALRRLITIPTLGASDRAELEHLCRQTPNAVAADGVPLIAIALDASHLPPAPGSGSSVTLEHLCDLVGVNRLAEQQKLQFSGSPGLTIIYGDNGTGKSGYARIIKRACRTRGAAPVIQSDVFATVPVPTASCTIRISTSKGGEDLKWQDGVIPDVRLANVFVFDSAAASHYLQADGPAAFTPHGLDVLPKLSKICDAIASAIKANIGVLEGEIGVARTALGRYQATTSGKFVAGLTAKTTDAAIDKAISVSVNDESRRVELGALLSVDARQKAKETRASKARIESFFTELKALVQSLAPEKIEELRAAAVSDQEAATVAKDFTEKQLRENLLSGSGEFVWRQMWEAARKFSTDKAYPEREFPHVIDDALCLLCQQSLDANAVLRLRAFEAFCMNESQKRHKETQQNLANAQLAFAKLEFLSSKFSAVETDLVSLSADDILEIKRSVTSADSCLATIKQAIDEKKWIPAISPHHTESILQSLIEKLEKKACEEESAEDPERRKSLEMEHSELEAKVWLRDSKEEIKAQRARLIRLGDLTQRLKDANTRTITSKNAELAKALITESFCNRFSDELKHLGLHSIEVALQEIKGAKGETVFGIRITNASRQVNLRDIASEGEQRCVSLAAFLAELSQSSHKSTLVFDDPASSMDHHYRDRIAARLVSESQDRQVIVFTHDAVFVQDLQTHAEDKSVIPELRVTEWGTQGPGVISDGLPWVLVSLKDRFDKLGKLQRELRNIWTPIPSAAATDKMKVAYSLLRATVERIVEQVAFGNVVSRFRRYVDLGKLNLVVGFSEAELRRIKALFKTCCDITEAHDAPAAQQARMPDPSALAKDIAEAEAIAADIRSRQSTTAPKV